jgi:carbon storage regulator
MLILTRRLKQTLTIGSDITVTVMQIRGGQVRIGVSAPEAVRVLRGEILEKGRAPQRPSEPNS